jgi:hypothetical protein
MKALTITQPWATLVVLGAKKIETRSWKTPYRGPLAIHAAKGFPKDAQLLVLTDWRFFGGLKPQLAASYQANGIRLVPSAPGYEALRELPRGVVIATCRLVDCVTISREFEAELDPGERAFGNYESGRFAWILEDVKPLEGPIPAKGMLSLWEWWDEGKT